MSILSHHYGFSGCTQRVLLHLLQITFDLRLFCWIWDIFLNVMLSRVYQKLLQTSKRANHFYKRQNKKALYLQIAKFSTFGLYFKNGWNFWSIGIWYVMMVWSQKISVVPGGVWIRKIRHYGYSDEKFRWHRSLKYSKYPKEQEKPQKS